MLLEVEIAPTGANGIIVRTSSLVTSYARVHAASWMDEFPGQSASILPPDSVGMRKRVKPGLYPRRIVDRFELSISERLNSESGLENIGRRATRIARESLQRRERRPQMNPDHEADETENK